MLFRSQGQRRRGPDINYLQTQIGFDDQQADQIGQEIRQVFGKMRSQFQAAASGGGDMSAIREQMSQDINAVFRKHLTKDQFDMHQKIRRQSSESRPGQVWIQAEDGEISPVRVGLGISDDTHTQLISKELEEGDVTVTRIRRSRDSS